MCGDCSANKEEEVTAATAAQSVWIQTGSISSQQTLINASSKQCEKPSNFMAHE